eukprot:scaffold200696_cov21-Tisochrysis_lutea.AAC.2
MTFGDISSIPFMNCAAGMVSCELCARNTVSAHVVPRAARKDAALSGCLSPHLLVYWGLCCCSGNSRAH